MPKVVRKVEFLIFIWLDWGLKLELNERMRIHCKCDQENGGERKIYRSGTKPERCKLRDDRRFELASSSDKERTINGKMLDGGRKCRLCALTVEWGLG